MHFHVDLEFVNTTAEIVWSHTITTIMNNMKSQVIFNIYITAYLKKYVHKSYS